MPPELHGRRVDTLEELERPGDYCVCYQQRKDRSTGIGCLWFVMPDGEWGRIAGKGFGQPQTHTGVPEPEWEIAEDKNGIVTVKPSIDYPGHWHGHLQAGTWIGA